MIGIIRIVIGLITQTSPHSVQFGLLRLQIFPASPFRTSAYGLLNIESLLQVSFPLVYLVRSGTEIWFSTIPEGSVTRNIF
jgi:hypothetical protein